jgi:hypothetical protein
MGKKQLRATPDSNQGMALSRPVGTTVVGGAHGGVRRASLGLCASGYGEKAQKNTNFYFGTKKTT